MKTSIYTLSLFTLLAHAQIGNANQLQETLTATADTIIRKDRQFQNYGVTRHIAVTNDSAKNARVALVQFDTADILTTKYTQTLFRMYILDVNIDVYRVSDSDSEDGEISVLIRRVNSNFDEDRVTWSNYYVDYGDVNNDESEDSIEFRVMSEHVGKIGQVDVSNLMVPGENLNLAIYTSDGGHIKMASREHENPAAHPQLLILEEQLKWRDDL
jgi:hypothetical protein